MVSSREKAFSFIYTKYIPRACAKRDFLFCLLAESEGTSMTDKQQPAEKRERGQRRKERKRSVHGGGSVYQRHSEGKERWVAAIKDPETGKRLERYAKSQKEAYELLEQMKSEIRQGSLVAGTHQTVEKYLQEWFENVQKSSVKDGSQAASAISIRYCIKPSAMRCAGNWSHVMCVIWYHCRVKCGISHKH
jgi:hypothetical protein